MNKYEKIIQTLRYIDNPIYISNHDGEIIELMNKAADALEQLRAENILLRAERDQWRVAAESSRDGVQPMLRKRIDELTKERDAALGDLYTACKVSPCNNGICVKENCRGNIIPCEFEWRGARMDGHKKDVM